MINLSAEKGNDLVLIDNLVDGRWEVGSLAVEETHSKVFGPLAGAEDEQDAEDDGQVVVLLDYLLPRVVCWLWSWVRRLLRCKLNWWDQTIDDELKPEVEDGDDNELGHDSNLEVNAGAQLVDLIIMNASLLGF